MAREIGKKGPLTPCNHYTRVVVSLCRAQDQDMLHKSISLPHPSSWGYGRPACGPLQPVTPAEGGQGERVLESELPVPGSSQVDAPETCQMLNDRCPGSWSESIQNQRMGCRGPVRPIPKEWQFGLPLGHWDRLT